MRPMKYKTEEERKEAKRIQSMESHRRARQGVRLNAKYKTEEEKKEGRRAASKIWREKNKDKIAEYKARYYEKNRERIKERMNEYHKKYGDKYKTESKGKMTKAEVTQVKILQSLMKKKKAMSEEDKAARRARLPEAVRKHLEELERIRQQK